MSAAARLARPVMMGHYQRFINMSKLVCYPILLGGGGSYIKFYVWPEHTRVRTLHCYYEDDFEEAHGEAMVKAGVFDSITPDGEPVIDIYKFLRCFQERSFTN